MRTWKVLAVERMMRLHRRRKNRLARIILAQVIKTVTTTLTATNAATKAWNSTPAHYNASTSTNACEARPAKAIKNASTTAEVTNVATAVTPLTDTPTGSAKTSTNVP